jgi:ERCC4-related helicase
MDMVTKRLLQSQPSYQLFRQQLDSFSTCSKVASGRFTELLRIVRDFIKRVQKDNTSRAIIFVHMRRTCLKLREELNKDAEIKKLKPLACVGHGNGLDGMQWKGEQEVVITR